MITLTPPLTDCGCPDETQKPLNESDASKDSCGDLATYPEPCPKGLSDLYCTKFTGSADPVFGVAPGDRGSTVLVKIMNKIKELHGLGVPASLLSVNNIIVSNITSTTVNFSWAAVAGATQYDIRYRVQGQTAWQYINSIAVTNVQLTNLGANTTYEYGLRARNATTGYSDWTATAMFLTLVSLSILNTPVGMASVSTTPYSFAASWTAVIGATSYEVRVRKFGAADTIAITPGLTGVTGNPIAVPEPGVTYEWQVIAKATGYTDSVPSAWIGVVVKVSPPVSVTVSPIGQTTATVSWPASQNAVSYTVDVIKLSDGSVAHSNTTSNVSYPIPALTANTGYDVRIKAVGVSGISDYYNSKAFVTLP